MTLQALFDVLVAREQLPPAAVERTAAYLDARAAQAHTPWYIQSIVALGAWVAAVMFVGVFMLTIGESHLRGANLLCGGLGFIACALAAARVRILFVEQFALAMSVGGHLLLYVWAGDMYHFGQHWLNACAAVALVAAAVLYPLYRTSLHRYLSVLSAMLLLAGGLLDQMTLAPLLWAEAALSYATLRMGRSWRPLAYALCTALPLTGWMQMEGHQTPSPLVEAASQIVMTLWLLWVCRWAAEGWEGRAVPAYFLRNPVFWAVILLGWVGTPAISVACGLLVLGFGRGDRPLLALGYLFVAVFLFEYYYSMKLELLTKSWILIGSGVTLLAARSLLLPGGSKA